MENIIFGKAEEKVTEVAGEAQEKYGEMNDVTYTK